MKKRLEIILCLLSIIVLVAAIFVTVKNIQKKVAQEDAQTALEIKRVAVKTDLNLRRIDITPNKTKIGDIQTSTVSLASIVGIESVVAQIPFDGGIDTVPLQLVTGDAQNGIWVCRWTDHDTTVKEYTTKIIVTSRDGKNHEYTGTWWDDVSTTWYNGNWKARKSIVISSNGTGNADYQIKITIPYLTRMKSDFSDVVFTDTDGITVIPYWRESYTASSSATFWIRTTTPVSLMTRTVFYYYGNPAQNSAGTMSGASGVFNIDDISGLVGGWNLDEGSGTTTADASGQSHPFTFTASKLPSWITNYSGALGFTGTSCSSGCANGNDMSTGTYTLSSATSSITIVASMRLATPDSNTQYFITKGVGNSTASTDGFVGLYRTGGTSMHDFTWNYATSSSYTPTVSTTGNFLSGCDNSSTWCTISAVANYSAKTVNFYKNNATAAGGNPLSMNAAGTLRFPASGSYGWHIGSSNNANYYATMGIDEIQLYNVALTTTQIGHLYCSGSCMSSTDNTRAYFSPAYAGHTLVRKYMSTEPGYTISTQEQNKPMDPGVGVSGGAELEF